ncbi:hypothetical protein FDA94_28570 [Herbidospora galbida]|uniref:Uncharacterized protein n=1 Tax=Herbidospora galbida TaxID=2575442 RepID=A0A4U3MAJ2_9ACTN|nr:hypothetical protein [Herbidospora galbida]TKK84586.1 hypothetical protein FDA94_28570 [Herbidospora galbida]
MQLAWWSCDGHPVTKEEPWNQSQATQTGVTQVPLDIAEQLLGREKRSLAARIRTDIAWGVSAGRISSDDVRALKPFGPVPDVVVKWYWEQLERGVFDEAPSLRALVRLAG